MEVTTKEVDCGVAEKVKHDTRWFAKAMRINVNDFAQAI